MGKRRMTSRRINENKFGNWVELSGSGRLHWLDVPGRMNWKAWYLKEVDSQETTIRFWQEIFDERGVLVEVHHKYPTDFGHRSIESQEL
jgi:hypothetical protein